jgi:hypothetical protein
MNSICIGTSAFTAAGWEGTFYPEGTKPADFLRHYAQHFNSVVWLPPPARWLRLKSPVSSRGNFLLDM